MVRSQTIEPPKLRSRYHAHKRPPRRSGPERSARIGGFLSWDQRLARNARPTDAPRLIITLHGLPATFASSFGFALLTTA
ncbi:hypothetical protein [Reticulibacter mediterranei]|uniref:hypothetical protein n=1 Tax=Reticulibacter mediterranei TaxID=2778369 RepID=UPI001C68ED4A|nr:hypothetical protein [Reticulibacter mediterranei]